MIQNKKIAIIGCGNLGLSILNGLLALEGINAANLTVTKRNVSSLKNYEDKGVLVTTDNVVAVKNSDIIIVALKPYMILSVLSEISSYLDKDRHVLVSLASGVNLNEIQNVVGVDVTAFRAMPNTAADVGMSLTCIASNSTNQDAIEMVRSCFDAVGETLIIDENLLDSATVLGACGIAYVMRFMRAMVQGGVQIGFDSKTATQIVNQTVKGASQLLIERKQHPEFEIDKVTTPKGCTIRGLNEMEHNGFSSALIKGIVSSFDAIEK